MNNLEKTKIGFVYNFEIIGKDGKCRDSWLAKNLMPNPARDYAMNAMLTGGSQFSSWYIGLFANSHTPDYDDTMATLLAGAGEITSYSGGARKLLVPDTIADGVFSNSGASLYFDFTANTTVRGGFITSSSVQGNTTGLLLSLELNPSPKTITAGESLKVSAGLLMST